MLPSFGQDGGSDGEFGWNEGEDVWEDHVWLRDDEIDSIAVWFDFAVDSDFTGGGVAVTFSALVRHCQ
ncbi:hypothetical protein ISN44_As11g002050 [Arabidopsis suecica]|uniref:Uncharacterized protein n=1 Tax=Arabidopsis suecica TaxID=45249 RepID=A0A8T1Z7G2_ARASU|nr:hypothetical protein ISN44_As11g002050 [Arabidopsis suecica]